MRYVLLSVVLTLCGCLGTQPPANPLEKAASTAAVPSAAPAAVDAPMPAPPPPLLPETDKVELMKEMFLVQRDLNQQLLKMAEDLTADELLELNEWLEQFGVQIQRRRVRKPSPELDPDRVY